MSSRMKARIKGFKAGADLSAGQYKFVKWGSADDEVILAGANERAVGVLMNDPASGQRAEVAMPGGGALLKVSETVTAGKLLTSTAAALGEIVDLAAEPMSARAEQDGVANDVIEVYVLEGSKAHDTDV